MNPVSTCRSSLKTADQKSGADEQHDRECDFRDDEHTPNVTA